MQQVSTCARLSGRGPAGKRAYVKRHTDWGVRLLNWIWLGLMLVSIGYAAFIPGRMEDVASAILDGASTAVQLIIGLVGAFVYQETSMLMLKII